jgi:hypothetical protein
LRAITPVRIEFGVHFASFSVVGSGTAAALRLTVE